MISFVIPTLQEEKVIEKLLKNLKTITAFDYEIIVSDGGSRDKTREIAEKYTAKITVYQGGKKQTIGQARNAGAALAQGDFLVFLDADVHIFNPDEFLHRALAHFKKDPNLSGLGGWLRVFKEMETIGDKIGYGILTNWSLVLYNNILHSGAGCGEFGMIKTAVFKSVGGYREDLAVDEDQDLFRRLAKIGRTLTDPKLLLYHTGRRPHAIGWPKLLWQWSANWASLVLFNRSADEEWKVIR
jgi:glycosyltransferase involved in cell wall biosynthesis